MAKKRRYLTPLTFNLVAVIWIIGLMPLAVAFVSNIGSDPSNDDFERMSKDHIDLQYGEGNSPLASDPTYCSAYLNCTGQPISWVQNGDDFAWAYSYKNPSISDFDLDCLYIKDGVCKGTYDPDETEANTLGNAGYLVTDCDTTGLWVGSVYYSYNEQVQYNCEFADPNWWYSDTIVGYQEFQMTYDGSWFYRGQDSHSALSQYAQSTNITDSTYIGESGETYSIRLNELMMQQIPAGEMIDQIRFTFFDYPDAPLANPSDHNCDTYAGWEDLTISTTLTQQYEGEENELGTTYITDTDNKFYMDAQPTYFTAGCYIGYEVIIDLNGFDTRSMHNFVEGKYNESALIVEFQIERSDGLPLGSTNIAFAGVDDFAMAIDFTVIDAQTVEFTTNAGLLAMGGSNIVLAIASTAYWDPFKNFFKGAL